MTETTGTTEKPAKAEKPADFDVHPDTLDVNGDPIPVEDPATDNFGRSMAPGTLR